MREVAPELSIRVVPITRELADEVQRDAFLALNGDQSCSLSNMRTSCFGSETCASRGRALRIHDYLGFPHAHVAVHQPRAAPRVFVGCVSARPARGSIVSHLFPDIAFPPDALVVSNLCVSERFQKKGVGRMLLQAVGRGPVFLTIDKRGEGHPDRDIDAAFCDRVRRLRATYDHLGFHTVCECGEAVLMRHRV